jgi:hypothetical protein
MVIMLRKLVFVMALNDIVACGVVRPAHRQGAAQVPEGSTSGANRA